MCHVSKVKFLLLRQVSSTCHVNMKITSCESNNMFSFCHVSRTIFCYAYMLYQYVNISELHQDSVAESEPVEPTLF